MIEEQGTIIEKKGDTVIIKTPRSSACEGCGSKQICHATSETDMVIEADNPVDANVGDRVVFMVGAATIIKAGVLFYLIPLLSFIAGVVLGQVLSVNYAPGINPDMASTALGFFFLMLTFIGLKVYGKAAEKRKPMRPQVVRVV